MKSKSIVIILLISLVLTACAPVAAAIPTQTDIPTSTFTPIPPTPTITPTPTPESIADAKDLSIWVDEFVHAYDGTVVVNGVEMDANRLTIELRENGNKYIESKKINDTEILFLVVNEIPLAMREGNGQWQEVTMAKLSEINGVIFEFSPRIPGDRIPQYVLALKKVAGRNSRFTFPGEMDTCSIYNDFSTEDWKSIMENWENIQIELNNGKVPNGYPYKWQGVYDIIEFARKNVEDPQFRAQHMVEGRLNYCMLAESIINLWEKENFNKDEMLKVLEFVIRTRVIQFPEVTNWDVQDEMMATDVQWTVSGNNHHRFWLNATSKRPAELTLLVADWIKKDNPSAKTYIVEAEIFNFSNPMGKWLRDAFAPYIQEIAENNIGENGIKRVDGFIEENNLSIHYPLDVSQIESTIDLYNTWGLEIGGSETMVFIDEQSIEGSLTLKNVELVPVEKRKQVQAQIYYDLLSLYLKKGIRVFGFGGIDDYNAWTNDVDMWNTDPLLFDDNFRAKPAYYAIVQVLYEQLP
jgi:GH35 family endo-1,4-beta-xylanase